jgi:hypothetical protein
MPESARAIEIRIVELRERMRGTLDRSKHPAIREKIVEAQEKLKALGGIDEE